MSPMAKLNADKSSTIISAHRVYGTWKKKKKKLHLQSLKTVNKIHVKFDTCEIQFSIAARYTLQDSKRGKNKKKKRKTVPGKPQKPVDLVETSGT